MLFRRDRLDTRFAAPRWRESRDAVPLAALVEQLRGIDAKHCQRLVLSGGAPLEHPEFDALVAAARELGFERLALESDAAALAKPGLRESLEERGFGELFLYVGGRDPQVHEAVLAEPGSFADSREGLRRAAAGTALLYVIMPIVRANADDVEGVLDEVLALGGAFTGFLLALPEISRVPEKSRRAVLPYRVQGLIAEMVFRRCQGNRVEYGFTTKRGILPCTSADVLERYAAVFHERLSYLRHVKDDTFGKVEACATCSLKLTCPGVETAYLEVFGARECRPVPLEASSGWKLRRFNTLESRKLKHNSPFQNDVSEERMALVRINGHCNMSCSFCFIDRTVPDFDTDQLAGEIAELREAGYNHLVLSGGEPTLHPDLPGLVRHARGLGFRTIELQSNGVKASDPEYARALVEAGLDEVCTSLHHVDPDKSDEITRLPRAFGKTVQALHNFQRLGLEVKLAHVITKLNYETLPEFVRFVREEFPASEGPLSICFGFVQPMSDLVFSWVIPRFRDVKPYFRKALDYCLENGLGFGGMLGQGGCPPCVLDGEMKYYEMNLGKIFKSPEHNEEFYKAERCRECSFDPYCLGVRRDYVAMYDDSELVPFTTEIRMPDRRVGPVQTILTQQHKPDGLVVLGVPDRPRDNRAG